MKSMRIARAEELRHALAGATEFVCMTELGIADLRIVGYLTKLLLRFASMKEVFCLRGAVGLRIEQVADMLHEARQRQGGPRREAFRHIGDFTLFWYGFFPEMLRRLCAPSRPDHLIDYVRQGQECYYEASQFTDEPYTEEAPVLRMLSEDFERCAYGLSRVRREISALPQG